MRRAEQTAHGMRIAQQQDGTGASPSVVCVAPRSASQRWRHPRPVPEPYASFFGAASCIAKCEKHQEKRIFTLHRTFRGMCMILNSAQRHRCAIHRGKRFPPRLSHRAHATTTSARTVFSTCRRSPRRRASTDCTRQDAHAASACAKGRDLPGFPMPKKKPRQCRGFVSQHQIRIARIRT